MPAAVLDEFSPRFRAQIASLGYRLSRWSAAREALAARVAKRRLPEDLRQFLEKWAGDSTSAPMEATLGESTDGWHLQTGGLVGFPKERALLHLPALRAFWIQELRLSHFTALQEIVPTAWFIDETPVPPGAVIAGIGISSWAGVVLPENLDRYAVVDRSGTHRGSCQNEWSELVRAGSCLLVEKIQTSRVIRARFMRDERGRIVLEDVTALP